MTSTRPVHLALAVLLCTTLTHAVYEAYMCLEDGCGDYECELFFGYKNGVGQYDRCRKITYTYTLTSTGIGLIVTGCIVLLALLIGIPLCIWCCIRRRRQNAVVVAPAGRPGPTVVTCNNGPPQQAGPPPPPPPPPQAYPPQYQQGPPPQHGYDQGPPPQYGYDQGPPQQQTTVVYG